MGKRVVYRIVFLAFTVLVIPVVPILVIFVGVSSPEYVIKGILNIDLSQTQTISYLEVYTTFLRNMLRLDLGTSATSGKSVINIVSSGMLNSLIIIIPSMVFSYIVGALIGIWTEKSRRANCIWNKSQFIFYIPMIVFSYCLLYLLSFIGVDFLSNRRYLAAIIALSIYPIFVISNSLKKTLAGLRHSDFFLFHKSLGFGEDTIWKKYCRKLILVDFLSYFENILIYMIGFLYFTETPFGINGMGYRFVFAVQRFDYPVIIGFCVFGILLLSIVGLMVDTLKLKLDPRLAHA
jgi:ABC-type dipeptide/oligopeptide/nickel transport system permease component